jgi:beta-glucosidase
MKRHLFLAGILFSSTLLAQNIQTKDIPGIMKKLTLEEKVNMVVGAGMNLPGFSESPLKMPEKVPGAAGNSYAISSVSIPSVVFSDGPAGVRIEPRRGSAPGKTFYATAFPVGTLLSSTWDPKLVEEVGRAFGNEAKEYGIDILLAPALNIQRNPLGGRNFEYYSEDPLLSGKTAAAFVRGVQTEGVGTSIKHFVANNQETNRLQINVIASERALREIYLKGFEIAVKEGKPWTVMSSYNKLNGVYTSQRHDLLTTILRDEWNFKGFVMTDWFSGDNAVEQMKAGNDLLMPGTPEQKAAILKALKDGTLSEEILNKNVERILNVYVNTPSFKGYHYSDKPDLEKHKMVSQNAASQGMVLLKNNKNALPLGKQVKVALFGNAAFETICGGTGSGDVNKAYSVSIYQGLKDAGYRFDDNVTASGFRYIEEEEKKIPPKKFFFEPDKTIPEKMLTEIDLVSAAIQNDVAIYVLGRTSGEMKDRTVENDFNLSKTEQTNIRLLSKAFHREGKNLVVLLNIGGVIETNSWKGMADAILLTWQPGQEAGHAVADVVSGNVNPSGKLPATFPINYNDLSTVKNFPGKELTTAKTDTSVQAMFRGKPSEVVYEEGIYVGYRYFETFKVPTSFPFGFGLSYTTFSFSDLKISQLEAGKVKINFTVTNTGKTAGKEVAQVYISAPDGKLKKPGKELKAFLKTKLLIPGEKQDIEFVLSPYQMSSFDTQGSAWIMEKGIYSIFAGSSVDDLPLSGTLEKLTTDIVLKTNNALAPTRKINTLR